jgi:PHP family Zn ribbon phosphoesterase
MIVPEIYKWAKKKGINLVGTGDFTHPFWLSHLKENLVEEDGFLKYKDGNDDIYFLLTVEVSSIYSQGGKARRIHNLVFAPGFSDVEKINKALASRGTLSSDGRPILGISCRDLAETIFEVSPQSLIIPAHIWTPHFALYGSNSGFDSIEECFGDLASQIYAIETGLSSDPAMNWRIKELDNRQIVSFSDAHSPAKLGREATIFEIEPSFDSFSQAIKTGEGIAATIEFFPEEGKYHYTGHRNCNVRHSPQETKKLGTICPNCNRPLTVGVMHRVEELATRSEEEAGKEEKDLALEDGAKVRAVRSTKLERPIYFNLVPLQEVIAEALEKGVQTSEVEDEYEKLIGEFGSEFSVLLKAPIEDLAVKTDSRISQAIKKVRRGEVSLEPGFDGVYGKVKIFKEEREIPKEQMTLFG